MATTFAQSRIQAAESEGRIILGRHGRCHMQHFIGQKNSTGLIDLRSCTVIVLAARLGAIVAHIQPTTNLDHIMMQFALLYHQYENHYFTSTNDVYICLVKGVDIAGSEGTMQEKNISIMNLLNDMGFHDVPEFSFRNDHEPDPISQAAGKGTVFVDGWADTPFVYVEDTRVNIMH